MKKFVMASLMVVAGASVGCSSNQKQELAQVPPPPAPLEQGSFEPVQVQAQPATAAAADSSATVTPASYQTMTLTTGATHTIQKGDTLYSIARKHYGSGNRWQDIVAANPGLDPQKLPVGKTIVLP